MNTSDPPIPIAALLSPRSVAVIGASEDQGKFGGRVLQMLLRHRYAGTIYPINPNRKELLGLEAYPSVAVTPQAPDMAIMAVPQAQVKARVQECADRGVRCAIIITARFSDAGPEGAAIEAELVAIARAAGMRLIGPNCLGVISPANHLVLCSSPALDVETLPRSPIGFITQSGALMGTLFDRATAMGIGFSHCVSVGNQADLALCDFIEFLIDDPHTRVICSYIEGVKSPARFVQLARRARAAGKPWLAVKAGRTAAGSSAAFSHTASLAGDYAVLKAVCERENIVLLNDVFAMLLLAAAMAQHPAHRVAQAVLISTSGGSAALSADALSDAGIPMTRFGETAREALATLYVPGQADNPVDLYGAKVKEVPDFGYQSALFAMRDADADICLAVITTAPGLTALAGELAQGCAEAGKPVLQVMQPGALANGPRALLRQSGQPFTDSLAEAVEAIRAWRAWSAWREQEAPEPLPALDFAPPAESASLGEEEAKALLHAAGIPVNRGVVVADIEEALVRADEIGYPLVAKIVSPQIVHKTEVGGVALDLHDAAALRAALTAMKRRVQQAMPEARIEGFFLQAMATGTVELLVGARNDPQFGPVLIVGSGGVWVELMKDVVLLPLPVSAAAVREALLSLRIAPLLRGYRGAEPVDLDAAVDAVRRLAAIAERLRGRDFEFEVNPLKLGPKGCMAVDARARIGESFQ
ncbi:acetate--CoA ligase family protein [Variovorax sp. PBL-E5]|uniref:acetate--CoA ligase family protein n=1 Tax=Variovorax sp. PBL-E5 TaxID=434014 RepID=UPI001318426C|nr:acetate--CoA ligase family protein [Variovorax sp. PBL-E5]VTU16255.1 Succinyl-CoA ligase [ADP-forming] subunit alpha [Variovorax sp. PBL-E5]